MAKGQAGRSLERPACRVHSAKGTAVWMAGEDPLLYLKRRAVRAPEEARVTLAGAVKRLENAAAPA